MTDPIPSTSDPTGARLSGQTVVITGASAGIGASAAIAFAAAGARVGLVARRADRLAEVAATCRASTPGAEVFVADLADLDRISDLATALTERLGPIDVLVNNAGVPKRRRMTTMTPADVESVMAMNYFSPVRLTLALLPAMVERGSGEIVNVSSMGVHLASFGVGAYSATKAALELFTEALYLELHGTGVRARVFVPGSTRSEFSTDKPDNDPPFPTDPATVADPDDVAAALVASIGSDPLTTYATARDAATAAAKQADPEGFIARMAGLLAPRR